MGEGAVADVDLKGLVVDVVLDAAVEAGDPGAVELGGSGDLGVVVRDEDFPVGQFEPQGEVAATGVDGLEGQTVCLEGLVNEAPGDRGLPSGRSSASADSMLRDTVVAPSIGWARWGCCWCQPVSATRNAATASEGASMLNS